MEYFLWPAQRAAWLCPSQLLPTCSLAECEKPEKVLDFIGTTENISVINILLLPNPQLSSSWDKKIILAKTRTAPNIPQ